METQSGAAVKLISFVSVLRLARILRRKRIPWFKEIGKITCLRFEQVGASLTARLFNAQFSNLIFRYYIYTC